jgi:hypothetical protein
MFMFEFFWSPQYIGQFVSAMMFWDDTDCIILWCTDNSSDMVSLGEDGQPHPIWKRHMVFGGTAITQHTETLADEAGVISEAKASGGEP